MTHDTTPDQGLPDDFLPETGAEAPAAAAAPAPAVTLGPELTIPTAAATRQTLLDALQGRGDRELDLGDVSDIDSAGVQLLLAARRSLAERGDALRITAASAAVRDALAVFGLQQLLAETADAATAA